MGAPMSMGFNGKDGWMRGGPPGTNTLTDELRAMLEREAELYPGARLRSKATGLRVVASATINGKEAWVVGQAQRSTSRDTLYFDKESGLLVRQTFLVPTSLGPLPRQLDYEDYRDAGGVKVPFTVKFGQPMRTIVLSFTTSEPNAAVADSVFEKQ
jgi:hypothetical protein